jgi:hypothetical protein
MAASAGLPHRTARHEYLAVDRATPCTAGTVPIGWERANSSLSSPVRGRVVGTAGHLLHLAVKCDSY